VPGVLAIIDTKNLTTPKIPLFFLSFFFETGAPLFFHDGGIAIQFFEYVMEPNRAQVITSFFLFGLLTRLIL
jgi:hypothetical protein